MNLGSTTTRHRAPQPGVGRARVRVAVVAAAALLLTGGCSASASSPAVGPAQRPPGPAAVPARAPGLDPAAATAPAAPGSQPAAVAWLSIPSIGVRDLPVVAYTGQPDDAAGTRIENRGQAASPRGGSGGVGPGVVGNFVVTGHRTAAAAPLRRLPDLLLGAHVIVRTGGYVYDYVVTATLTVSFRSTASKALQTAPVPGHPGRPATQAMITLSTCATPEDHANGDWWHDALGNPEHRIDKVGVLVAVRPSGPGL
jgi:sortase A